MYILFYNININIIIIILLILYFRILYYTSILNASNTTSSTNHCSGSGTCRDLRSTISAII